MVRKKIHKRKLHPVSRTNRNICGVDNTFNGGLLPFFYWDCERETPESTSNVTAPFQSAEKHLSNLVGLPVVRTKTQGILSPI